MSASQRLPGQAVRERR